MYNLGYMQASGRRGLKVRDRRVLAELVEALAASRKAGLADVLEEPASGSRRSAALSM